MSLFFAQGQNDSCSCAWFIWDKEYGYGCKKKMDNTDYDDVMGKIKFRKLISR